MNNSKIITLYAIMAFGCTNLIGQLDTKTEAEQSPYYVIEIPPLSVKKGTALGDTQITSVKLLKRINGLSKEIGSANCTYYHRDKKTYLSTFAIHGSCRNLGLGSYLLKYTMAYLQKTFDCSIINWTAYPTADPTPQGVARLIAFYSNTGAIDIDKNKTSCTKMHYPLPSAQMLTILMPILEPKPIRKNDKQIILANGATYATSPSDPLGIIANYMGETNE